jgi:hypothetical protein
MMVARTAGTAPTLDPRTGSGENRLFLVAHGVLLAVVLLGFARTFYLRPWLARNPIDTALVVHGAVLTSWFALAFAQAFLAATRRRSQHRRIAWLAAAVVPAVVVSSAWINTRLAAQIHSAQDPENMFVWGNYMSLVAFVGLVVAAVAARRRPDAHRRLLLMASIAIIGPAFARFAFWPVVGLGVAGAPPFAIGGMLALLALAIAYDRRTRGRVHGATIAGVAAILGTLVFAVAVAQSGLAFELTRGATGAHAGVATGSADGN